MMANWILLRKKQVAEKKLQYSKMVSPHSVKDSSRLIPCIYICQEEANMRRVSVRLFAGKLKQALSALCLDPGQLCLGAGIHFPSMLCPDQCILQWLWAQAQCCVHLLMWLMVWSAFIPLCSEFRQTEIASTSKILSRCTLSDSSQRLHAEYLICQIYEGALQVHPKCCMFQTI